MIDPNQQQQVAVAAIREIAADKPEPQTLEQALHYLHAAQGNAKVALDWFGNPKNLPTWIKEIDIGDVVRRGPEI